MSRRNLRHSLVALALGLGLTALAAGEAFANPPGGGRMAQGSVAGASRGGGTATANRGGSRNNVGNNVNNGNINSGNRNNVNIGNDVDIDIDVDHRHGYWGGGVYHPVAAGIVIGTVAVTRAAVVGSYYYSLPPGCTVVYRNGVSYWYCGTVYYSRTWYGNDVVYVVVNP